MHQVDVSAEMQRTDERSRPQSDAGSGANKTTYEERSSQAHVDRHGPSKRLSSTGPVGSRHVHSKSESLGTAEAGDGEGESTYSKKARHSETRNPNDSPEDSSRHSLSMLGRAVRYVTGDLSTAAEKEKEQLHKRLQRMESDLKRSQKDLDESRRKITVLERRYNQDLHSLVQQHEVKQEEADRWLRNERERLQQVIAKLQSELKGANKTVAKLEQNIVDNEAVVTKAHATVVSMLAGDVSRELPDDMVKNELRGFFQGDFFSWCADMSVPQVQELEETEDRLRKAGIINRSRSYAQSPQHLKFDMNLPDGSSSLVLLQAALAQRLCHLFLTNPFFLEGCMSRTSVHDGGQHSIGLMDIEESFFQAQRDLAVDWRIKTVQCLEKAVPLTRELLMAPAKEFMVEFGCLLQKPDQEAEDDLAKIFADFSLLALRLWKTQTTIGVFDMSNFADHEFQYGSDVMEGDAAVSASGRKLNGRPIGVLMRPLIMAEPIAKEGQPQQQRVVWSKALTWVSSRDQPLDEQLGA